MQALVSAAAYHFGSYRRAVELAGIDYSTVLRRPRWTRARIIALIKSAHRKGEDLFWSAVTHRRDELGKAAFAALQPRSVRQMAACPSRRGTRRRRHRPLSAMGPQFDRLRAQGPRPGRRSARAAARCRPTTPASTPPPSGISALYDAALRAAELDPLKFRQRRSWDKKAGDQGDQIRRPQRRQPRRQPGAPRSTGILRRRPSGCSAHSPPPENSRELNSNRRSGGRARDNQSCV